MTKSIEHTLEVLPFSFEESSVRIVMRDGEPWFIVADMLNILLLDRKAMERLDDAEKGSACIHTLGGVQKMTVIDESGLYSLIMRSRKPSAKKFKKWVTAEVLPSIRKTGSYSTARLSTIEMLTLAIESEKSRLLAMEQRDYAIATKALIGSRRETTASVAVEEVAQLHSEVGFSN